MKILSASRRVSGFTITDGMILLGAAVLLLSWGYYQMVRPRGCRAFRNNCVSNLKQVSLAFRMWSNDSGEQFPWAVSTEGGGTLKYANSPDVFVHFRAISNELTSPKPLVCPDDRKRQKATSFETNFSNLNISYFFGLDADERQPNSTLLGDRNVATNGVALKGPLALLRADSQAGWTKDIHKHQGNLALADGSANQYTEDQFRRHLKLASNGVVRLAIP